ncbi:MAG: hypothetical protein WCW40_02500, partial [Bacteroidota bacterium]
NLFAVLFPVNTANNGNSVVLQLNYLVCKTSNICCCNCSRIAKKPHSRQATPLMLTDPAQSSTYKESRIVESLKTEQVVVIACTLKRAIFKNT